MLYSSIRRPSVQHIDYFMNSSNRECSDSTRLRHKWQNELMSSGIVLCPHKAAWDYYLLRSFFVPEGFSLMSAFIPATSCSILSGSTTEVQLLRPLLILWLVFALLHALTPERTK